LKNDSQTADIPVIVLSGLGQQNEAKLKKEGAAAYFTKSDSFLENDSGTLLQVVESVVGERKTAGPVAATSIPFH
jgi:CheY-like chemotaxis protein